MRPPNMTRMRSESERILGAVGVLDAARLAVTMRRGRSSHLGRLRDEVDLPLLLLPYLFVRDHGLRVTRMVAEALGQELGY